MWKEWEADQKQFTTEKYPLGFYPLGTLGPQRKVNYVQDSDIYVDWLSRCGEGSLWFSEFFVFNPRYWLFINNPNVKHWHYIDFGAVMTWISSTRHDMMYAIYMLFYLNMYSAPWGKIVLYQQTELLMTHNEGLYYLAGIFVMDAIPGNWDTCLSSDVRLYCMWKDS